MVGVGDFDGLGAARGNLDFLPVPAHFDANAAAAAESLLDKLSAQRGLMKGRLRIGREGDITHVRINDVYLVEESELAFIKKELYDNLTAPNLKVLLDLKNVRRMSSIARASDDQ